MADQTSTSAKSVFGATPADTPYLAPGLVGPESAKSVFGATPAGDSLTWYTVEILERRPHDPEAFTQGLEFADGALYESTGLYGRSSLRSVDPVSGTVTAQTDLSADLFGEGLTVVDDRIVQLTWRSGRAIAYDRVTLAPVGEHRYEGEGWGLCHAADALWMSDGSDRLSRRDTRSFGLIETVRVTSPDAGLAVHSLNELECTEGRVIANMWQTDRLLVIDVRTPGEARVEAVIDATPLAEDVRWSFPDHQVDVLNGVADPRDGSGTLWLTGKRWPVLYRVRLVSS